MSNQKKHKCYAVLKRGDHKGKFCYEVNKYCKNAQHRGYNIKLNHHCTVCGLEFPTKYKYKAHFQQMLCIPIGECPKCNFKDQEIEILKNVVDDMREKIKTLELPKESKSSNTELRKVLLQFLDKY